MTAPKAPKAPSESTTAKPEPGATSATLRPAPAPTGDERRDGPADLTARCAALTARCADLAKALAPLAAMPHDTSRPDDYVMYKLTRGGARSTITCGQIRVARRLRGEEQ